jgi:quinol-cytochrome oxidoreductase complex cytochrome b subunit
MFRKLYLRAYSYEQESTWKSGGISFLLIHGIIFFGLVLSCTHLSDVTLTIAANIVKTICFKYGKLYWVLFTDQTLNTDTVIRLAYIHYILPFFLVYLGFLHAMDMHYGWKDSMFFSNTKITFFWFSEVLKNEFLCYANVLLFIAGICFYLYSDNEPLSFELFMWGDLGFVNDVRFLSVAPHWYFRAYMGWLILCPHHYIGIFGLIYFFVCIYFQPNIQSSATNSIVFLKNNTITVFEISFLHKLFFSLFIMCILYAGSFLPYGRFYISVGGNFMSTLSYVYIYIYLSVPMTIFARYTINMSRKYDSVVQI